MDETPPEGCGALLRVEVVPVERIFGTSRPATASAAAANPGTSSSSGTPSDTVLPAYDPNIERKVRTWRALTLTGYAGFLGSIGLLYGGVFMRAKNKPESVTEPGDARQEAIRKTVIGEALLWSGVAGMAAFGILAVFANKRWVEANRRKQQQLQGARLDAAGPILTEGGAGLGLRGRF